MGCHKFKILNDSIQIIEGREWILASYLESYGSADAKGRKIIKDKMHKIAFPYFLDESEVASSEEIERLFGNG